MIYGIDPGARKLAVFGISDRSHTVGCFEVPQGGRFLELGALRERLLTFLLGDDEPLLFCEEPVVAGARNLHTTILIAETVGMVLSTPWPAYTVPVSSWKKATVGKGNVDKFGVSEWLRLEYGAYFSSCDGNQDAIDAAAIAVYGRSVVLRTAMDTGSRSPLRGDLL